MAKKSKEQEHSPKKLIQNKIITHLLQEFQQLETLVGKKEWAKRLKKSAKIITQGLEFEEATKEDVAEEKPAAAAAAPKKSAAKKTATAKPATKKASKKSASPKAGAKATTKKAPSKKTKTGTAA